MAKDAPKLTRVRTGPSSYLEFNDADLKAWRDAGNAEYGTRDAPPEAATEPTDDAEAKAADEPTENKARTAPAEKKAGR